MILALLFLVVFMLKAPSLRKRSLGKSRVGELNPPPRIFVQPSQTKSVRHFAEGQVSLMKLQSEASLMIVRKSATGQAPCFLLKNEKPFQFESTLLTTEAQGGWKIHAPLKDRTNLIVFKAP